MIELLELKFSRRWQTNKIESDWSNSARHSSSRQFRSPRSCSKFKVENIATNCSMVAVIALAGLTKKRFGHYAILKMFCQKIHIFYLFFEQDLSLFQTSTVHKCTHMKFSYNLLLVQTAKTMPQMKNKDRCLAIRRYKT